MLLMHIMALFSHIWCAYSQSSTDIGTPLGRSSGRVVDVRLNRVNSMTAYTCIRTTCMNVVSQIGFSPILGPEWIQTGDMSGRRSALGGSRIVCAYGINNIAGQGTKGLLFATSYQPPCLR